MNEWIESVNGLITLIIGGVTLVGMGIGLFFAIKNWIKLFKEKDNKEKWTMVQEIADAAMKEAEHSDLDGPHKKEAVISIVVSGCKAAGIDASLFANQLSLYIDSCITWYNGMKK